MIKMSLTATIATVVLLMGGAGAVSAQAARAPVQPMMLADFENGALATRTGGPWITYDDRIAGGRSSLTLTVTPTGGSQNTRGLRLEPNFSPAFRSPFVGAQAYLNARRTPVDLRRYSGVSFMARGEGVFQLQVITGDVVDHNYYTVVVRASPDWTRHDVAFADLKQSPYFGRRVGWNARNIRGVGIHLDQATGGQAVEIDQIRFY